MDAIQQNNCLFQLTVIIWEDALLNKTKLLKEHLHMLTKADNPIYITAKTVVSLTHLRLPKFQFMTSHDCGMYIEVISLI